MINALIIDKEKKSIESLNALLLELCPSINLCGFAKDLYSISNRLTDINVVFLNTNLLQSDKICKVFKLRKEKYQIICFGDSQKDAYKAFKIKAAGFLLRPYQPTDFLFAINEVLMKITANYKNKKEVVSQNDLIGIPGINEMQYFSINQIIRCEGYLKCTKMMITDGSVVVSSYNIGEFIKLLTPFGFYAPHKSHLINLKHVKKYLKEGTIILSQDHKVPVARRRKAEFLSRIPHL